MVDLLLVFQQAPGGCAFGYNLVDVLLVFQFYAQTKYCLLMCIHVSFWWLTLLDDVLCKTRLYA
jgi:hypothetical protein